MKRESLTKGNQNKNVYSKKIVAKATLNNGCGLTQVEKATNTQTKTYQNWFLDSTNIIFS